MVRPTAERIERLATYWADLLSWFSEDDPARYLAALKMDTRDFYRLKRSKEATIKRLTAK